MLVFLQQTVPFRSAALCLDSGFDADRERISIRGVETFNEPEHIVTELPAINGKHSAFLQRIARQPRVALAGFAPSLYASKNDAELRTYIRRYGHEHNLIIADIDTPRSRGLWLSLWRPGTREAFSAQDQRALTFLMPHLVEARTINRRLALGPQFEAIIGPAGTRALIKNNGTIVHAGFRFRQLLGLHWPGALCTRLPADLLAGLQRQGVAVVGGIQISAAPLGDLQMLSIRRIPVASRLSKREYAVAAIYGSGRSYKEISKELNISPVTVRNVIQHIYRKLEINNKACLVRELMEDGA
jgi:DNA-binding CsgD family transcriptional regulator